MWRVGTTFLLRDRPHVAHGCVFRATRGVIEAVHRERHALGCRLGIGCTPTLNTGHVLQTRAVALACEPPALRRHGLEVSARPRRVPRAERYQ